MPLITGERKYRNDPISYNTSNIYNSEIIDEITDQKPTDPSSLSNTLLYFFTPLSSFDQNVSCQEDFITDHAFFSFSYTRGGAGISGIIRFNVYIDGKKIFAKEFNLDLTAGVTTKEHTETVSFTPFMIKKDSVVNVEFTTTAPSMSIGWNVLFSGYRS